MRFFDRNAPNNAEYVPVQAIGRFATFPALDRVFTLFGLSDFSAIPQAHFSSPICARRSAGSENPGCSTDCMPPLLKFAMLPQAALRPSHRAWVQTVLCLYKTSFLMKKQPRFLVTALNAVAIRFLWVYPCR